MFDKNFMSLQNNKLQNKSRVGSLILTFSNALTVEMRLFCTKVSFYLCDKVKSVSNFIIITLINEKKENNTVVIEERNVSFT
jgi:hypothetical protein